MLYLQYFSIYKLSSFIYIISNTKNKLFQIMCIVNNLSALRLYIKLR
ncbi:hypothetical protein LM900277_180428 [Listeria monocytogenes]|nr:hypothetical protein LM500065_30004 [Listeria monocytogenes]CUK77748.1 hypothetical protein LM700514_110423 [Listeria monocytogenes]CUL53835.1 hypothetical protein LM800235_100429 [Listeria monocytogenes]CUL92853.1 hypothetical protein LM900277_180428 [Listeria monocytogenes]